MNARDVLSGTDDVTSNGYGRGISIMILSALLAVGLFFVAVLFAWASLPFMGDESNATPAQLIAFNLAFTVVIDLFAYWRFKKLNKHWLSVGGRKLVLQAYQGFFLLVVVGANLPAGAVVWFYLFRDSA